MEVSVTEILPRILPHVLKPQRYVGEEMNIVRKDLSRMKVKVALAFPEVYELGMSHMGLRILYHLVNKHPDYAAERVYCPWTDMESRMRREKLPLYTLESKIPVRDFDVVGFSLQSELNYSNVLTMIDLAGDPVHAVDRGEDAPLYIAGGPCVANPEPIADFLDAVLIGDGEELLPEFLEKLAECKEKRLAKEATLLELAQIEGVYVPRFYEFFYDGPKIRSLGVRPGYQVPRRIRRRFIKTLKKENYPEKPLVPATEITHDRLSLEVMRGCTQGCRFCQAGYWYRPVREMPATDVVDMAVEGIKETGFSEVGLCSLSTADYSAVNEVSSRINETLHDKKISISLPSLRADQFSVHLADNVSPVRKAGFTFAPEAGSWRLRQVINKSITNENMYEAADVAYSKGWDMIKLYVMVGLPTENDQDLQELVDIIRQINAIGRKYGKRKDVTISTGAFVPKAFTPFQWEAFEARDVLGKRIAFLKQQLPNRNTRFKWHDLEGAEIEVLLSRGDRRVARVIHKVWKEGARFDAWSSEFDHARWLRAMDTEGIPLEWYTRRHETDEILPWDLIQAWITKRYLLMEKDKAFGQGLTTDCKWGDCHYCGIKGAPKDTVLAKPGARSDIKDPVVFHAPEAASADVPESAAYRIRFAKRQALRYVGHLDLLRIFEMVLRRADIPLAYTQGFHQRPRIHFGPALPLGLTSETEWADFEVRWTGKEEDLLQRLQSASPDGFAIGSLRKLEGKVQSLGRQYVAGRYDIPLTEDLWQILEVDRKLQAFQAKPEFWLTIRRKEKVKRVDLRRAVLGVHRAKPRLEVTLSINDAAGHNTNPATFLQEILCLEPAAAQALDIRRVALLTQEDVSIMGTDDLIQQQTSLRGPEGRSNPPGLPAMPGRLLRAVPSQGPVQPN